jgi:hypothetical protein
MIIIWHLRQLIAFGGDTREAVGIVSGALNLFELQI